MTFVPKSGGDPIVMKGRYTDMSRKIGDEWLYIFDHASVPLAPPSE
jgi:ketosteroid isomerase-like protein